MNTSIVGDRLYGIEMRPQEMALFGDRVHFHIRFSPIADEDVPTTQHFKLLVLEVVAPLPEDHPKAAELRELQVLKCGWELELSSDEPLRSAELGSPAEEARLLLGRIADTVNELARRAGLEAPLGIGVIDELVDSLDRSK